MFITVCEKLPLSILLFRDSDISHNDDADSWLVEIESYCGHIILDSENFSRPDQILEIRLAKLLEVVVAIS